MGTDTGHLIKAPLLKRISKKKMFYLFLLPACLWTFIFCYIPMAGIAMAFNEFNPLGGLFGSPFVGLKHFRDFLSSDEFYVSLINTFRYNLIGLLVGFPMPIIFALLLNEIRFAKFKKSVQTITYLPHFISWVIIAVMVYRILDYETGSLNSLISAFGGEPIAFMKKDKIFLPLVIGLGMWKELGWSSIIYLAAITGIDPQQYEAATVDGAGRLKRLWHVTIPGMMPTVALLLILSTAGIVSGGPFDAIMNLTNPYMADEANILSYYTYLQGILYRRFSYATAVGLAQSVAAFVIVMGSNWLSKRISNYSAF